MTHLLIVEDNRAQAEALRFTLESEGFEVSVVPDGMTALRLLANHEINLVLSDVHMPEMSGFELCARLKRDASLQHLPVILLTSRSDPLAIVQGLEAGADNFITKPYEPAQLVDRVRTMLTNRSRKRRTHMGVDVTFLGRHFVINAEKEQILDVLVSAFEEIVRSNRDLAARTEELDVMLEEQALELAHAKERAEQGSRYKSQFVANMSHEFRTPLNAVIGFSELLDEETMGPLNERQKEFVGYVAQGGRHLLALINDILDLSRVEAGHMQLTCDWVSPDKLVDDVRQMVKPLADEQGVHLLFRVSEGLPPIYADPIRVKQILYNLLSNGIKFNHRHGKVELTVSCADSELSWCVADSGMGMRREDLARLFREFERIEHRGQKPEGTGLGLALTKRLVELHGGSIQVESLVGQGSTFTVRMPLRATVCSGSAAPTV